MNPNLFFLVLRARFGLFALVLGATLLATAGVSLLLPKSYRATASLVVDRHDSQSFTDGAYNGFTSPAERTAYLQTQLDIIKSPKVARKVVDSLGLAAQPAVRRQFEAATSGQGSIEDWEAARLQQGLEVETSQSNVIQVSYNAHDPAAAAGTANAFAQAYIDTSLELHVDPDRHAAEWFDEQLKTLRADLQSAQQRMTDYQREHGIVSADEKLDDEYSRLSDLSTQLSKAQAEDAGLEARRQLVQQAVAQGRPLEDIPEIRTDAGVQALKAHLVEGEATLQVLAARYGENYPEYSKQLAENRSTRSALNAEMQRVAASTASQVNEGQARTAELAAALATQRARLLDLKQTRDGLEVLARNVNTAQTAYDTAMQRRVVNQVQSRASQADAALLNAAVLPQRPHSPNLPLNLALAALVGVMLGVGLVMLREMTDRRIHSGWEIAEIARAPMLGELIAWNPPANRLRLPAPAARQEVQ
ncbi:MAG TPA: GNVR domain-containing protein [Steroidobacteraceae bacterium]|nr:GNVR domain-containing protein [Steroidobacteraceae bacterium]